MAHLKPMRNCDNLICKLQRRVFLEREKFWMGNSESGSMSQVAILPKSLKEVEAGFEIIKYKLMGSDQMTSIAISFLLCNCNNLPLLKPVSMHVC